MIVTQFGIGVFIIGLAILIRGSLLSMLMLVLACSLMGGSAALVLPALGNASIQPISLALLFFVLRAVTGNNKNSFNPLTVLSFNFFMIIFCVYGALTAFILPKIFSGQLAVTSMRFIATDNLFQTSALQYSAQNATTAFYLLGTLMASILTTMVAPNPRAEQVVIKTALVVSWVHIGFGILGVILTRVGAPELLDFFRNATYAQVSQEFQGFIRINGIFPEASAYTAYAFFWFVLMVELWLRDVSARATGFCAAGLGLILLFSTSSSAYVGAAGYAAVLLVRWMLFPASLSSRKAMQIGAMVGGALAIILALAALVPDLARSFGYVIQQMTVGKMGGKSGLQRAFWALQGVKAFEVSRGLGIGAGSFRSSSLFTAILGSMGVIGIAAFVGHLIVVLKPWRMSTFGRPRSSVEAMGVAASWAACVGLIPAAINSPSPDPGILFGIFSGLALGWRALPSVQAMRGAPAFQASATRASPAKGHR